MSLEIHKIIAHDGKAKSFFGNNVSVYNDNILISSPCDSKKAENSGAIYFYSKIAGLDTKPQKIILDVPCAFDYFGEVIAFNETTLLASACLDINDVKNGVVYVFNYKGDKWVQTQKLMLENDSKSNSFGETIALEGNRIIIGSHVEGEDEGIKKSIGSVFIFEKDEKNKESKWEQVYEIKSPLKEMIETKTLLKNKTQKNRKEMKEELKNIDNNDFGYSIALNANKIVIGSFLNGNKNAATGAVYIYEKNKESKWIETHKLIAEDLQHNAFFGNVVVIKSDRIIIGAHGADDRKGAVYVFEYNDDAPEDKKWKQAQKLESSDGKEFNCFGNTIALSENKIIAGAYSDSDNGEYSGSVYIFEEDKEEKEKNKKWKQTMKISSHEEVTTDYFGESLAIHNDKLLIGAYGDDENGICAGAVHVCDFKN